MLAAQRSQQLRRSFPALSRSAFSLTEALGLSKGPETQEVLAIDPRMVLQPEVLKQEDVDKAATRIKVHRDLVAKLPQGEPELADHDEPGNAWYFGERAEIFDYRLVGEHKCKSGYTSLIHAHTLDKILRGEYKDLPSWDQFVTITSDTVHWPHKKLPFLFAGRIVEASMAALYTLERQGRTVGLLISSESSGGTDD